MDTTFEKHSLLDILKGYSRMHLRDMSHNIDANRVCPLTSRTHGASVFTTAWNNTKPDDDDDTSAEYDDDERLLTTSLSGPGDMPESEVTHPTHMQSSIHLKHARSVQRGVSKPRHQSAFPQSIFCPRLRDLTKHIQSQELP